MSDVLLVYDGLHSEDSKNRVSCVRFAIIDTGYVQYLTIQ